MPTPEEITIQIPALTLAARVWGPADGVPMLALHGWLDNAASFDGIAPLLPGVRLCCLDMPGHGRSDHVPPGVLYGFVDTVARVFEVTRALGWERFSLMGHSLGAAVASVLAGTFVRHVERLVLIEGLGPMTEQPAQVAQRLARSIDDEHRRRGRAGPVYARREDAVARLCEAVQGLAEHSAQILVARGLVEVDGGFTWRADPQLRVASRQRLTEAQVLTFLRAIEAPTLVIRGSGGYPFAPDPMGARVAALRDAKVVELPGGHHLHLDTPEPVAGAIAEFLRATSGG
ncbi:MAG: alpha/beta hydrolase [Myxococcota bacterium]